MDKVFEFLMVAALDIAMLLLVISLAEGKNVPHARLTAVTMGIGFLLGVVARCIDGVNLLLIPDALGAVLAYTAVLLTVPAKKSEKSEEVQAAKAAGADK